MSHWDTNKHLTDCLLSFHLRLAKSDFEISHIPIRRSCDNPQHQHGSSSHRYPHPHLITIIPSLCVPLPPSITTGPQLSAIPIPLQPDRLRTPQPRSSNMDPHLTPSPLQPDPPSFYLISTLPLSPHCSHPDVTTRPSQYKFYSLKPFPQDSPGATPAGPLRRPPLTSARRRCTAPSPPCQLPAALRRA